MSLLLLFPYHGTELRSTVKIVVGHQYQLICRVRSNVAQTIRVRVDDSASANNSLDTTKVLSADTWETINVTFTGAASDKNSQLRLLPDQVVQNFYADRFRLIDLTLDRKQYRIMRIQGSLVPGSFVQTLTLREKTDAETA